MLYIVECFVGIQEILSQYYKIENSLSILNNF